MEKQFTIDVAALDPSRRRALEEVIGLHLTAQQRLFIRITDLEVPPRDAASPACRRMSQGRRRAAVHAGRLL